MVVLGASVVGMVLVLHFLLPLTAASVRYQKKKGKVSTVSSFAPATNGTSSDHKSQNGIMVNGSDKSQSSLEPSLSGTTSIQRSRSSKIMSVLRDALASQTSNDKSVHRYAMFAIYVLITSEDTFAPFFFSRMGHMLLFVQPREYSPNKHPFPGKPTCPRAFPLCAAPAACQASQACKTCMTTTNQRKKRRRLRQVTHLAGCSSKGCVELHRVD